MNNVVDFTQAKIEREPHASGPCRCLHCGHEWVGVVPVPLPVAFECPLCHLDHGVFISLHAPSIGAWTCRFQRPAGGDCDTQLFYVTRAGVLCAACGGTHHYADILPNFKD